MTKAEQEAWLAKHWPGAKFLPGTNLNGDVAFLLRVPRATFPAFESWRYLQIAEALFPGLEYIGADFFKSKKWHVGIGSLRKKFG